jgi:hypothetical protein
MFIFCSFNGTENSEARQNNFYSDVVKRLQRNKHQHQTSQCFPDFGRSIPADNAPHHASARARPHTHPHPPTHPHTHTQSNVSFHQYV